MPNSAYKRNLHWAHQARNYIERLPSMVSSTAPGLSSEAIALNDPLIGLNRNGTYNESKDLGKLIYYHWAKAPTLFLRRVAKNSLFYRAANCTELTYLAYKFLVKRTDVCIEMVSIINGDHIFIVLGRSIDLADFAKGADEYAIVYDPLFKKIFPAKYIQSELSCHAWGLMEVNGEQIHSNEYYPFNPNQHTLMSINAFVPGLKDQIGVQGELNFLKSKLLGIKRYLEAEIQFTVLSINQISQWLDELEWQISNSTVSTRTNQDILREMEAKTKNLIRLISDEASVYLLDWPRVQAEIIVNSLFLSEIPSGIRCDLLLLFLENYGDDNLLLIFHALAKYQCFESFQEYILVKIGAEHNLLSYILFFRPGLISDLIQLLSPAVFCTWVSKLATDFETLVRKQITSTEVVDQILALAQQCQSQNDLNQLLTACEEVTAMLGTEPQTYSPIISTPTVPFDELFYDEIIWSLPTPVLLEEELSPLAMTFLNT